MPDFFRRESSGLILGAVLLVIIPVLNLTGLMSDLNLNLLGRYLCFALAAMGIGLIWGQTGILSLCQAFFFCLGGYCIGMHMLLMTGDQGVYGSARSANNRR
jgi:urea transport system permease protein